MAQRALKQAPGVLAVEVNYETKRAVVGTEPDQPVPRDAILEALASIGYSGEFLESPE